MDNDEWVAATAFGYRYRTLFRGVFGTEWRKESASAYATASGFGC